MERPREVSLIYGDSDAGLGHILSVVGCRKVALYIMKLETMRDVLLRMLRDGERDVTEFERVLMDDD